MTPEAAKQRSNDFMRQHKLNLFEALPVIESPEDLTPPAPHAVAKRALVLGHMISIGFGAPVESMKSSLEEIGLLSDLSEQEISLLNGDITPQQKINCTWLTECVQALGWCLGLVELDPFRRCDDDLASHFPEPFCDPHQFITDAELRPFDQLFCQADLHYRLHWSARDCRLHGIKSPIEEEVIQERRRALDWTIGVSSDWDNIPMDT